MKEATDIPCITSEEAIHRQNMLEDSMIALGIDPSDQSKHWTIYYVVETVREPDGKKVNGYPLSKAFLTKEPAKEAKATLLAEHPGAGV